jgi:hypothetical protein
MTMALMGFLDGWLATHVGTSDQRFGVFLRERRAHVGRPRRARPAGWPSGTRHGTRGAGGRGDLPRGMNCG